MRRKEKWREFLRRTGALLLAGTMLFSQTGIEALAGKAAGQQDVVSENTISEKEILVAEQKSQDMGSESDETETQAVRQKELNPQTASASELKNPVHYCDTTNEADKDYSTFSYVYFGSYPQTEVTDSGIIAKINANLSGSGDTWVNGVKYRKISSSDTNYDYYFSENTSSTYRYFKWERIRWKVLHTDGSKALLVAANALDCQEYNEEYTAVTWESCSMRKWLNGYTGFTDLDRNSGQSFTATSFYATAFDASEQGAILQSSLTNAANPEYNTAGGNATSDKVFLLSLDDIKNTSYGFCSDYNCDSSTRWARATDYSHAVGVWTYTDATQTGGYPNCWWWLRSPGLSAFCASNVNNRGFVNRDGGIVDNDDDAVVPALSLNLASDTWSTADDGSSGSGGNGGGGSNALTQCAKPIASTLGGSFQSAQTITLSTSTQGAEIYYTIDGSEPSEMNGIKYTGSIKISGNMVLKAVAVKKGITNSEVMTENYQFGSKIVTTATLPALPIGTGSKSGSVNDSNFAKFFPGDFEANAVLIPVKVSQTTDPVNGTTSLKVLIGLNPKQWFSGDGKDNLLGNSDRTFSKYKECVDQISTSKKRFDCLAVFGDLQKGCIISSKKFEKKPDVKISGYAELTYDKNGNLIKSDGKIVTDAKWEASKDWQFMTGIGPMYITLKGGAKASGNVGVTYETPNGTLQNGTWKFPSGKLTITPSISLEGGYGIAKVATIGVSGGASFPFQAIPWSSLKVEANASVHVYLIFVIDATYTLGKCQYTFWDTTAKKLAKGTWAEGMGEEKAELSMIDRSYNEKTTKWKGKLILPERGADGASGADTELVLQSGIMPTSLPMMHQIGNKKVMLFQTDDKERTALNASKLMYSVFSDGEWSEPKALADNGTLDAYADLQAIDGELYAVWQKEKDILTMDGTDAEGALKKLAEGSEIYLAKFNQTTGAFDVPIRVTENTAADMMPKLAVSDGSVAVTWVRNTQNDLYQSEGENQVICSYFNGTTMTKEQVIYTSEYPVENVQPFIKDGKVCAGIVTDTDVSAVRKIVLSDGNQNVKTIKNESSASDIIYAEGVLHFYENGRLWQYDVTSDKLEEIVVGDDETETKEEGGLGANARVFANGAKTAILYTKTDENGQNGIYATVKGETGFGEPVKIYQTEETIRYFSAVLNQDNSWDIVMNREKENGLHQLVYTGILEKKAIEVDNILLNETVSDSASEISYIVTNAGEENVDRLNLVISDDSGNEICRKVVETSIPSGASAQGSVMIEKSLLESVESGKQLSVSIVSDKQEISDATTQKLIFRQTDLSVDSSMSVSDEDICIVANVKNESDISSDAIIRVYSDVDHNNLLAEQKTGEIGAGEEKNCTFYIKKTDLKGEQNNAYYLPVVAEALQSDACVENNETIEVIYLSEKPDTGAGNNSGTISNPVNTIQTKKPLSSGTLFSVGANTYVVTNASTASPEVAFKKPTNSKAKKAVIPASITKDGVTYRVTAIGDNAFKSNKKLTAVTLPATVTSIGKSAFAGCTSLKKITIPAGVRSIGANAFKGDKNLKKITVKSPVLMKVGKNAFKGIHKNAVIKVPKSQKKNYQKLLNKKGQVSSVKIK